MYEEIDTLDLFLEDRQRVLDRTSMGQKQISHTFRLIQDEMFKHLGQGDIADIIDNILPFWGSEMTNTKIMSNAIRKMLTNVSAEKKRELTESCLKRGDFVQYVVIFSKSIHDLFDKIESTDQLGDFVISLNKLPNKTNKKDIVEFVAKWLHKNQPNKRVPNKLRSVIGDIISNSRSAEDIVEVCKILNDNDIRAFTCNSESAFGTNVTSKDTFIEEVDSVRELIKARIPLRMDCVGSYAFSRHRKVGKFKVKKTTPARFIHKYLDLFRDIKDEKFSSAEMSYILRPLISALCSYLEDMPKSVFTSNKTSKAVEELSVLMYDYSVQNVLALVKNNRHINPTLYAVHKL